MAANTNNTNAEKGSLDLALFMEEVQKYDCIYNKFSKEYKDRNKKINCWKAIGEKFDLSPDEAEKKFKNTRTAYGRFLKKKKSVPSGSGREAVPVPREFLNLDWLSTHMSHRPSISNVRKQASSPVVEEGESEGEEDERPASIHGDEPVERNEESDGESTVCSDFSSVNGDNSEKASPKENETSWARVTKKSKASSQPNTTPTSRKKSTRPWSAVEKKNSKEDLDLILIKTASSIVEKINDTEPEPKRRRPEEEENDEDYLFCRGLAQRMKRLPAMKKYRVRLQIEQMLFHVEFQGELQTPSVPGTGYTDMTIYGQTPNRGSQHNANSLAHDPELMHSYVQRHMPSVPSNYACNDHPSYLSL